MHRSVAGLLGKFLRVLAHLRQFILILREPHTHIVWQSLVVELALIGISQHRQSLVVAGDNNIALVHAAVEHIVEFRLDGRGRLEPWG